MTSCIPDDIPHNSPGEKPLAYSGSCCKCKEVLASTHNGLQTECQQEAMNRTQIDIRFCRIITQITVN